LRNRARSGIVDAAVAAEIEVVDISGIAE